MATKLITSTAFLAFLLLVSGAQPASSLNPTQSDLPYFDMVVDEARGRIYASGSQNSLVVHDMNTLQVIDRILVGSMPRGLDMSPDGEELAVAIDEQGEIAFIDLNSMMITDRVVPDVLPQESNKPYDVIYGRPSRLYSVGSPVSGVDDFIHVIDTGTKIEISKSEERVVGAPRLAITGEANTLFVFQTGHNQIRSFDVSTDEVILIAQTKTSEAVAKMFAVNSDGSKLFTSMGQVWSGDLQTVLAKLLVEYWSDHIEYVDSVQRVFISEPNKFSVFDTNTYEKIISMSMESPGVARADKAGERIYISNPGGLKVFRTDMTLGLNYLPVVKMRSPLPGLVGRVTFDGGPVDYAWLELRYFDGESWSTYAITNTYGSDHYYFKVQPLSPGQAYYVRYVNNENPYRLAYWQTRVLESYSSGTSINIGNFDLKNIELLSPAPGAATRIPAMFQWQPRKATLTDSYEFNLFDGGDGDPYFYSVPPLGYTGQYVLKVLPDRFSYDNPYYWDIWSYSPDGGVGVSYWAYQVTFPKNLALELVPDLIRVPASTWLRRPSIQSHADLPPDLVP